MEEIKQQIIEHVKKGDNTSALMKIAFNNEKLFTYDPKWTISTHLNLLIESEKLGDAVEELSLYKTYPYISMEIEDLIKDYDTKIKFLLNKKNQPKISSGEIRAYLSSDNIDVVSTGLFLITENNPHLYINDLKSIMISQKANSIKSLALLILLEINYLEKISIIKNGQTIEIDPSKITMPFADSRWQELSDAINHLSKDVTQINFATEYAKSDYLNLYPLMFDKQDIDLLAYYYHFKAINALGGELSQSTYILDYGLKDDDFTNLIIKYHLDSQDDEI